MPAKLFTNLLFLFALTCLQAQENNLLRHYKVQHWDTRNGLPNNIVLTIHQSLDGFIWLTGYTGLTRFDGVHFTVFNSHNTPQLKADNLENGVLETPDTTLWIPTASSGLLAYKNNTFRAYMPGISLQQFIGQLRDGQMLFSANNLNKPFILFNPLSRQYTDLKEATVLEYFAKGAVVIKNAVDREGNLWVRIRNKMLRIQQGIMHELTATEGILPDAIYTKFYTDKQNRVWLASNKGLFKWDGKRMVPYPGMEKMVFRQAYNIDNLITEDENGGLWLSNFTGLCYLPPGMGTFEIISNNANFKGKRINNVFADREQNLWFSSPEGIFKLSYSKFATYSSEDGLPNDRVSAVCAVAPGKYLVGSEGKLYTIEDGRVFPYNFKNKNMGADHGDITYIYRDHAGTLWVATMSGVLRLDEQKEKFLPTESRVSYITEDASHHLWFGVAWRGIYGLDVSDTLYPLRFPGIDLKSQFISSISKLQQGGWLVTSYNKGVLLIDTNGKADYFVDSSGVPRITGAFGGYEERDGTIWLATQKGIYRYKDRQLSHASTQDGMLGNPVFNMLFDKAGDIWMPGNSGILRVSKQQLTDYVNKKTTKLDWKFYDEGDGMRNRECVGARHSLVDPEGHVLVLSFGGLVDITPGAFSINQKPPPVVIHRAVVDDSLVDVKTAHVFAPGNHRYIFDYSALSLVAPEKVQIKFKLIGYDKDWITSVGDRKAFYTNIPAGQYSFQVIASNNDGVWNEKGDHFDFVIRPFFYQTPWFILLVVAAMFLFIWWLISWRTKAIKKRNQFLEAQVAARTKSLNESNAELAVQKEGLEKAMTELKSTQSQLIQSAKMASLGELTAGIAHEIQNPLNFVNNFAELNKEIIGELKAERQKGPQAADNSLEDELINDIETNSEKINHHGKRAEAIVKGMLQHSRIGSGAKEAADINKLADEYLRLAYHGFRAKEKEFQATLHTDFDETIGSVRLVPQDIGRVLLNLFNNAFHAIQQKSRQATPGYQPQLTVFTKQIDDQIEIKIQDNGTGIAQDSIDKIFQPFFTTKPTGQGTGLGLSLAYDIVKAHGGELSVESDYGQGTTMRIVLPVQTHQKPSA